MTARRRIAQILIGNEFTAKELSGILGIREKEVLEHLPHVERSLGKGQTVVSQPARCLGCGFDFKKRRRFTSPGRCPVCKSQHISDPVFGLSPK